MNPCIHPSGGDRFGRLVIVDDTPSMRKNRQRAFEVQCDCGTRKVVLSAALRAGSTLSCGCLNRDTQAARLREKNTTHGQCGTPTYECWRSMISRCTRPRNKEWSNYGGRGIAICDRWLRDFSAFLADMGEKPSGRSIDRIDVDGNYEPGNCRWATSEEQGFNRRTGRLTLEQMGRLVGAQTPGEVRAIAKEAGVTSRYANGMRRKKGLGRGLPVPMFGHPQRRAA